MSSRESLPAVLRRWSPALFLRGLLYVGLALLTLLIHGYHPFAEDGGLYLAGIEWRLHPRLFPKGTPFVTEHLRFSVFSWLVASTGWISHLPLAWCVFLLYVLAAVLSFAAADLLLQRLGPAPGSFPFRLGGLFLLAAWWTLPVAGTSLSLFDPYLTARSLSTPLCLLALALSMDAMDGHAAAGTAARSRWLPGILTMACLLFAAVLHPLMTGYGVGLLLFFAAARTRYPVRWNVSLALAALLLAAVLQQTAGAESPAAHAADVSRYYWFLSRWQWYEWLGLAGPVSVLWVLWVLWIPRLPSLPSSQAADAVRRRLAGACLPLAGTATLVALVFAHESNRVHAVARLQPLRAFLLIYLVMVLLLGGSALRWWSVAQHGQRQRRRFATWILPGAVATVLASAIFSVARSVYPASAHLELPWRTQSSPNAWVRAFLWCREHTPQDALFALDAHYISYPGEDAQSFRAIAGRSVLPDFSKDGGEAAISPALAPLWQAGVAAQTDLNILDDTQREARLQPFGVEWLVLPKASRTNLPCVYQNEAVKVCRL